MSNVTIQPKTLEEIATVLGHSLTQIALDIHAVATHCEATRNQGIDEATLAHLGLPTYFLQPDEARPAWMGILFFNDDKNWNGWMCRKKPYWLDVWIERFGSLEHQEISRIADDWKHIQAKKVEDAKPKRKRESWARGSFSRFSTHVIGFHFAFAYLMEDRFGVQHFRRLESWTGATAEYVVYQRDIWRATAELLRDEILFRVQIGDMDALAITGIDRTKVKQYADLAKAHDANPYDIFDNYAHWRQAVRLYYTDEQIRMIQDGEAWPYDFEPLRPAPALPKVVHVVSADWSACDESERVYIGRNMRGHKDQGFGNPHKVAKLGRIEAIELFKQEKLLDAEFLRKVDAELRGKRLLGCWCKSAERGYTHWHEEDQPCHGDWIVELLALPVEEFEALVRRAEGEEE